MHTDWTVYFNLNIKNNKCICYTFLGRHSEAFVRMHTCLCACVYIYGQSTYPQKGLDRTYWDFTHTSLDPWTVPTGFFWCCIDSYNISQSPYILCAFAILTNNFDILSNIWDCSWPSDGPIIEACKLSLAITVSLPCFWLWQCRTSVFHIGQWNLQLECVQGNSCMLCVNARFNCSNGCNCMSHPYWNRN